MPSAEQSLTAVSETLQRSARREWGNRIFYIMLFKVVRLSIGADGSFLKKIEKSIDKRYFLLYNIIAVGNEPQFRGVTQFGRVLGLGPRCRRFKSCHLDLTPVLMYRGNLYIKEEYI